MPRQPTTTDSETQLWKKAAESVYDWVSSEGATGLVSHSITDCVTTYIRKMAHNLYRLAAQHGGNLINPNDRINQTSWIKSCAYSFYRIAISSGVSSGNLIDPTVRSKEDLWIASISLSAYRLALLTGGGTLLNPSSAIQATSRIRSFAFSAYQLAVSGGGIPVENPPVNDTPPSISSGSTKEVTQIICGGQVGGSLDTLGFDIDSEDGVKTVRINDAADVSVVLAADATDVEVATAIEDAMEAAFPSLWTIERALNTLTITDNFVGARTPAVEVGGPFNFNITSSQLQVFPVGATLTRVAGTWTGADSVAGNWQHDQGTGTWVDIAGETGATYEAQAIYATENIRYNETATNGAGSVSEPSNELGPVTGLVLWLSDTGSDPAVWPNLGDGADAIQATVANQFDIVPAVINGRQIRRANGTTDFMTCALDRAQPYTVFLVARCTGVGPANQYLLDGGAQNQGIVYTDENGALVGMYAGGATVTVAVSLADAFRVIVAKFDGASSEISADGTSASGNPGADSTTGTTIGCGGGLTNNHFAGDIAEIRLFQPALDATNEDEVIAMLEAKYGL